ncbi:MAG: hypothetical protein PUC47_03730, partial [Oscillospiraceae bacterium]|nr:hypothetical protein [Oscillospiraceae bacterium]
PGLSSEGVQSVLLDVELKVQKADGSWETVTAENFPAEGVEVLLPYPEGTNKDDYTFVITHLITSGSKAGQTEVLQGTPEADGIRVRFTSLSPVVITYQAKDAGTAESPEETSSAPSETPAGTPGDPSESPAEAAPPKTGEAGSVVLWTLLSIGGLGAAALLLRRKTN